MMTEKLQPLSTQIAIPSQAPFPTNATQAPPDVPPKVETVEEEPYTIKCICNFSDDDGNTIYCETCDTWQHIDCFYPDNREEALRENFAHSCAECKPRPLDRQRAIERTQRLKPVVLLEEAPDKQKTAAKRPPSKGQKKKPKPNELQLNGNHSGHENSKHASPNDQLPPAKKAKTSHKPSHSTSSQSAKRSPSYANPKAQTNGHPPSPATTPPDLPADFEIHNFSQGFFNLHGEHDVSIVHNNSFLTLATSNTMSVWLREPERLREDTGHEFKDVFQVLPADINARKRALHVETKKHSPLPGIQLQLQYLTTTTAIERDVPLIELNGRIGFQKDYSADPEHLWDILSSPLPFVFFHPMLPLYIDTRKEGSEARYVRRSCKPNAVLDTYVSGGSEYHFWLVSDRYIAANEQITLPWDFRFPKKDKARIVHLLGLGDEDMSGHDEPDMDDSEYQFLTTWVHRILSEYGGCACDLGTNCAFARFHRHYLGKHHPRAAQTKKKPRKPKATNISPTSTGQATNSRAPSEGHQDDGPDNDAMTSGSARSKPPSRDRTPLRQGSFDQLGILTEPTDRDKRKVAMVEDSFRRMEQQHPPRKKKRTSDGTGQPNSIKPKSRTAATDTSSLVNGVDHYVDAGTSRSKSGSPSTAVSPSAQFPSNQSTHRQVSTESGSRRSPSGPRPNYCDASVQTDPVEGEWYSESCPGRKKRRRVISLSQRLLNNRHQLRIDEEERRKHCSQATQIDATMDADSPTEPRVGLGSPVLHKDGMASNSTSPLIGSVGETPATDVASSTSPTMPVSVTIKVEAGENAIKSPGKLKTPDLRVQMPAVPAFGNVGVPSATTPLSASGSIVQSPFSSNLPSPFAAPLVNGVHPSPVKKKLSLSDYTKRNSNKAAAGRPSSNSLKPSTSSLEDSKSTALESIVDSPTREKAPDLSPSQTAAAGSLTTKP